MGMSTAPGMAMILPAPRTAMSPHTHHNVGDDEAAKMPYTVTGCSTNRAGRG